MDNFMARVRSAWSSAKSVAKEPWCAVSAIYLFYIGKAGLDKYLLDGLPMNSAFAFLWERTLAFAQNPLVQLLMIPLALWMFGRGIRRIERRKANIAERDNQIRADLALEFRNEIEAATQLSQLMGNYLLASREVRFASDPTRLSAAMMAIFLHRNFLVPLRNGAPAPPRVMDVYHKLRMGLDAARDSLAVPYRALVQKQLEIDDLDFDVAAMGDMERPFVLNEHRDFLEAHIRLMCQVEERLGEAVKGLEPLSARMAEIDGLLSGKAVAYYEQR